MNSVSENLTIQLGGEWREKLHEATGFSKEVATTGSNEEEVKKPKCISTDMLTIPTYVWEEMESAFQNEAN